jgi:hypothetical protein
MDHVLYLRNTVLNIWIQSIGISGGVLDVLSTYIFQNGLIL